MISSSKGLKLVAMLCPATLDLKKHFCSRWLIGNTFIQEAKLKTVVLEKPVEYRSKMASHIPCQGPPDLY